MPVSPWTERAALALAGVATLGVIAAGPLVRVANPEVQLWMPLLAPALLAVGLGVYEGRRRRRGLPPRGAGAWGPSVAAMLAVGVAILAWERARLPRAPDDGVALSILAAGVVVGVMLVAALTWVAARLVGGRR